MLTATRVGDAAKVFAVESENSHGPFACPRCHRELSLRKGRIKVHHFAHKPPVTCSHGKGETEAHRQAKFEIYGALRREPNVSVVELEKDFGMSVADVYACIDGAHVAVEIQRSNLSVNEIIRRTENYHRYGVAVLWAGLHRPALLDRKFSPQAWEKWCHAAYYGRVYYWDSGQVFRVYHFGEYKLHVSSSTWYEGGSEMSAGGYERRSKRWRTPVPGVPCVLSGSFRSKFRDSWSGPKVAIPACTLYGDIGQKWWS